VRGVFDRLYATDEEIDAASREVNIDPMPAEAMRARMTAEEFAIYQNSVAQVAQDGKDELRVKLMREFQRGKKQWWRDEEARVRAEVTEEVDSQPVYAAFNGLQAEKLSQADLEYRYGADFIKTLPRGFGRIYGRNGTLFADQAAEKFGFASADEMMQALASMRQRRELIEAETAVRMRELHGDMLTDGSAYDAAQSALHNDRRAEVLAIELRAMGGKVASAQLKRAAESAIGRTRHSELRPYAYLLAGNRAAREAFKAAMAGDFDAARDAKQRELLNHHMYRAAHDAKTEADGIANHMRKLQTDSKLRAKIGKTGQEWLGQIDDILVRFSFSPLARTQKFRSLAEWAMAEEEQTGEVIAISPLVMDEAFKTNWREMTIDELRAIDDTLKSIEHVSKKLQEVLLNGRRYEMEQIVAKLMATIEASKLKHRDPKRPGEDLSLKDKFLAVDGTLWRPEKIMEMLDNGTTGIFHDLLWDRATKAQTIAKDLKKQVLLPLESLITGMNKADSARMEEVVYIGSLGAGIRRFELIGMALNMGNASNLSKLQRGGIVLPGNKNPTPLGHQTINEVKAALSESDWNMVQTMWRTIEQLYPHLNDLNQRAVGLPLKKVDPITVETPFGDIRGGYWPAVGNPLYSNVGEVQENSNSVSAADFFPQPFAKAATKHSFREARTEAAYPLQFDWRQVLSRHVAQATTDIAYHEFVKEVSRILRNQDVKLALIGKLGQEKYQGLNDWLSFQVNASMGGMASARPVHVAMQGIVANTAVAALGYKVMTAIGNVIVAPVQASHQIKGRYIAAGYAEFMANPKAAMAKVRELSGEMRHRHDHLDATFNQVLDSLSGKATLRKAIAKNAMEIHSIADVLATTGLWLGKYRQSLAEGMEPKQAIKAADKTIRTSQTAGAPKDLSAFERDPSFAWAKLFLGPMIIMQNEARGSFLLKRRRLQTLMAVWLLPAIVFEMAVGRGPDDDEEPEEWALRKILTYPMQTVPLLRDAAPLVEAAITGKQPMMRMNPVAEVAGSIINTGRKLLSDTADDGDKAQAIIQTGGLLTGLPGAAVGQLSNYAIDLATGETSMEGPGDIRFFFMRRKDDRLD